MIDPLIPLSIRCAFALLFAFAAIEKLRDRDTFLFQLAEYQLLPNQLVTAAGTLVIAAEIITALLLVSQNVYGTYGVIAACLILGVYGSAILINLLRGRTWMDCGCLGSKGEGLSYWLVLRNLVLIAMLSLILIPTTERGLVWLDYYTLLFFVLALSVTYITLNSLLAASSRSKMWWSSQ